MKPHWQAMALLYPPPARQEWPRQEPNLEDVDTRARCIDCAGLRGGYCTRPREAGLCGSRPVEMGTLKEMPQNCPGFVARAVMREAA